MSQPSQQKKTPRKRSRSPTRTKLQPATPASPRLRWRSDAASVAEGELDARTALQRRILRDGCVLPNGILKVDGFINHQVDPMMMDVCGKELARRFASTRPTKVLTAEISGIAPALTTALHLSVPVVYARKTKPITMPDEVFLTVAPSHTKGRMVELIVSPEYLRKGERILIIDDFLASGATIVGLANLARTAGSTIVGVGALIEKSFEGGRDFVRKALSNAVPISAVVSIRGMAPGNISFDDPSPSA